jgi:hypothetical protein
MALKSPHTKRSSAAVHTKHPQRNWNQTRTARKVTQGSDELNVVVIDGASLRHNGCDAGLRAR